MFRKPQMPPGFEQDPVYNFPPAQVLKAVPAELSSFINTAPAGRYTIIDGLAVLESTNPARVFEGYKDIAVDQPVIEQITEAHDFVGRVSGIEVSDHSAIEIQREQLLPGTRACWRGIPLWHVDVSSIQGIVKAPVLTASFGVGTDVVVGQHDVVEIFSGLPPEVRKEKLLTLSKNLRHGEKLNSKLANLFYRSVQARRAISAAMIINAYAETHEGQLPDGVEVDTIPVGTFTLIDGLSVVHASGKNNGDHPIAKTHLHVWPQESASSLENRMALIAATKHR